MKVRPDPSGAAIISPDFSPSRPENATRRLSGDHTGPDALSPPTRHDLRVANDIIHRREYGRPGRSLLWTL